MSPLPGDDAQGQRPSVLSMPFAAVCSHHASYFRRYSVSKANRAETTVHKANMLFYIKAKTQALVTNILLQNQKFFNSQAAKNRIRNKPAS
jgi:hypothetical protein